MEASEAERERLTRIAESPAYRELVTRRGRLAWALTALMLLVYAGYILLIAFDKKLLARPIAEGSSITIGIPMGIGVILFAIVLTAIYVRHANREFEPLARAIAEKGE